VRNLRFEFVPIYEGRSLHRYHRDKCSQIEKRFRMVEREVDFQPFDEGE
jgi:hypothetical protein